MLYHNLSTKAKFSCSQNLYNYRDILTQKEQRLFRKQLDLLYKIIDPLGYTICYVTRSPTSAYKDLVLISKDTLDHVGLCILGSSGTKTIYCQINGVYDIDTGHPEVHGTQSVVAQISTDKPEALESILTHVFKTPK